MTKKFKVTDGTTVIGPFDDGNKAFCSLVTQLAGCLASGATPINWRIEEVPDEPEKPKDVPELIPDFHSACEYLGILTYTPDGVNDSNQAEIAAFARLLTLCKAWNKADGWEPDWTKMEEYKFFTVYDHRNGGINADKWSTVQLSPFAFKTERCARQFGEQFIDLFRQLYGIGEGE